MPRKQKIQAIINQVHPGGKPDRIFELSPSAKQNMRTMGEIVLCVVATAGIITLAAAAPNIFKLIPAAKRLKRSLKIKHEQNRKLSKALSYLKSEGHISITPNGSDYIIEIQERGKEKILQMNFQHLRIPSVKSWDGTFWMILADIPTELRNNADQFRKKLKELGLYWMQKSVWLYPYDPRDQIAFITAYYSIVQYVTIMQVMNLESEDREHAVKYFKKAGII